jgi:hypothetical protein
MKIIFKRPLSFTVIMTLCLVAVTLFAATGCAELEKPDEDELFLHVKVENASEYSNVVEVILMRDNRNVALARGKWKDGGFTIALPKTLDPNYLHALINNDSNSGLPVTIIDRPTVTISNKNIKVGNVSFFGLDKDGKVVTCFSPFEIDKDGNSKEAFYTYVDTNVTISGYTEREGVILLEFDAMLGFLFQYVWWKKITTTYSIEWEKGWNIWTPSSFYDLSERIVTEEWSTTFVNRLKWYGGVDGLWRVNLNEKY